MAVPGSTRTAVMLFMGNFLLASCGTIVNGSTQRINIVSEPAGAQVKVDSIPAGETPVSIELKRGTPHQVTIEKPGYLAAEEQVSQSASAWIWGNILAGGIIGLIVDLSTGGMYNLEPSDISASLIKSPSPQPLTSEPARGGR